MTHPVIRKAATGDAEQVAAIYRPIVEETAISFEVTAPGPADMAARIEAAGRTHLWLVSETGSRIAGYAYATQHRAREAYRYAVESSAYVHPDFRGQEIATRLYEELFRGLRALGYFRVLAGITLPNPASLALHRKTGFTPVGTFRRIGFKFGAWHDVAWMERDLAQGSPPGL